MIKKGCSNLHMRFPICPEMCTFEKSFGYIMECILSVHQFCGWTSNSTCIIHCETGFGWFCHRKMWNVWWVKSIKISHWSLGGDDHLKYVLQILGSQRKDLIAAEMCSVFLVLVRTPLTAFMMEWSCLIRQKSVTVIKPAGDEGWMSFSSCALKDLTLYICLRF